MQLDGHIIWDIPLCSGTNVAMYTATGFVLIILWLLHTAETSVCIYAYIPILMML
jgi:hypothetical protein